MKSKGKASVRSKVWIVDDKGLPVLGQGRIKILWAIDAHGSINAAAKSLGMSYRGAWDRIRATEKRLGRPLLEKKTGGRAGGGSRLTPFARDLMDRFESLHSRVAREADRAFEEIFPDLARKA